MKTTLIVASVFAIGVVGCSTAGTAKAQSEPGTTISIFDGKTLKGWIDQENSAGTISGGDIKDFQAFAKQLTEKPDAVALDADTKLIPSFVVGKRDAYHAKMFMDDLASRLAMRRPDFI